VPASRPVKLALPVPLERRVPTRLAMVAVVVPEVREVRAAQHAAPEPVAPAVPGEPEPAAAVVQIYF